MKRQEFRVHSKSKVNLECCTVHFHLRPILTGLCTSWPPQEKVFIWPPFFLYNKRLLRRQKTGGACLYMPQDGHWLASFEGIPPPQKS